MIDAAQTNVLLHDSLYRLWRAALCLGETMERGASDRRFMFDVRCALFGSAAVSGRRQEPEREGLFLLAEDCLHASIELPGA